jgi:hypothetical protein
MSWRLDENGNPFPTTIADQRKLCDQLTIPDTETPTEIMIEQKEVMEEHKTLGVKKTIAGCEKSQDKFLRLWSINFGNRIRHSTLNRHQTCLAFNAIYMSSMKYGLPATALSCEKLEATQGYAIDQFLPKMGYTHGTTRALIFGPTIYRGCGVRHLYTEMQGMKLETMISHLRAGTSLGTIIHTNINYLQMLTGIEEPILESTAPIEYIEDNWLTQFRTFLTTIKAKMVIEGLWQLRD